MNMNSDNIQLKGMLSIEKYNAENKLIEKIEVPNLVVTTGKAYVASRIKDSTASVMTHMGYGTNGTAPAPGDVGLITQLGARVDIQTTTVANNIVTYSATFGPSAGTGSIVEAGIFNSATAGTMLCRTTFPVISKDSNEAIVITWNISVG
jgi:hypothetical protein